jgi:expansin (peptidoglycan-binding protein)
MLRNINSKVSQKRKTTSPEYSSILSAAVINNSFRQMLLSDPAKAVSSGYSGEAFNLNKEDKKRLTAIHAVSLADFAAQLSQI